MKTIGGFIFLTPSAANATDSLGLRKVGGCHKVGIQGSK
jgi:hypothetical protein